MRTLPALLAAMLAAMLAACAYPDPDCADGHQRDEAGTCQPDAEDTGEVILTGSLTGSISVDVTATVDTTVVEDVCEGTVAFEREGAVLAGEIACSFAGAVAGFIGDDPFYGTVDGEVSGNGDAVGPVFLDLGGFGQLESEWAGTAAETSVEGEFIGQMSFEVGELVVPVDYQGRFSAAP